MGTGVTLLDKITGKLCEFKREIVNQKFVNRSLITCAFGVVTIRADVKQVKATSIGTGVTLPTKSPENYADIKI